MKDENFFTLKSSLLIFIVFCPLFFQSELFAQSKFWVFFKDKPNAASQIYIKRNSPTVISNSTGKFQDTPAEIYLIDNNVLTQRAIDRRLKVLPPEKVVSISDFPVYVPYLDSLESIGLAIDGTSRWFNAAVVIADSLQLKMIPRFSFVAAIKKIVTYTSRSEPIKGGRMILNRTMNPFLQPGDSSFFGPSYSQFELSQIPKVHALGINGSGVLIGMLDDGFRYETHDALKNIKVVGEHDFIHNDSITANQPGDTPDQDWHGTLTLSVLGGFSPGNIVGAAYGASFMLAKTELIYPDPGDVDYKDEEDHWVEAIEWMESRGVDVVSSSLGYNIFVDSLTNEIDSSESYFWSRGDFNGRTALASKAATMAAERGVIVVDAMGNEGVGNGAAGTMLIPADADSIISVGAVDASGRLAYFSSTGPTNDGRIKPDLMADGVSGYGAVPPGPNTYDFVSGTSLSTPIVAGVAALVLSVRPDLKPMDVIDLLKSTAVKISDPNFPQRTAEYPNNFYGWGIVNAWNAIKSLGVVGSNNFSFWRNGSSLYFAIRAFSNYGVELSHSAAYYSTDGKNYLSAQITETDSVDQYAFKIPTQNFYAGKFYFYFSLVDSNVNKINDPFYGASSPFEVPTWMLELQQSAESFVLFNNYPNPFNSETHIDFALKNAAIVGVDVYDALGQKIRAIFNGSLSSGYQRFKWNGVSDNGLDVASGAYLIKVNVGGTIKVTKALYLK